jgi:hypothetical protein
MTPFLRCFVHGCCPKSIKLPLSKSQNPAGESPAFLARSPLHIKLLMEAKADLNAGGRWGESMGIQETMNIKKYHEIIPAMFVTDIILMVMQAA